MVSSTDVMPPPELVTLEERVGALEKRVERSADPDALAMVVFSGELDRLLAAFVIATGAAACGMKVTMFFTFWGTAALKKKGPQASGKSLVERMFGWMLPGGWQHRPLSRLDFLGLGRRLMAREMKNKKTPGLPELIDLAGRSGVELVVCEMSMSLMGIRREELIEYPGMRLAGVASFLDRAASAGTNLFL